MNHLQRWLSTFACVISMHSVAFADPLDGNIPSVLLRDAQAQGCVPIKGFFDRDGITLPPFFFDKQPANREYASAYVCEREKNYFLLLPVVESGSLCRQRELALGRTMPGGLAAFSHRPLLSAFRTFDNRKGGKAIQNAASSTKFRPLMIDYDGMQRVLYCYQGRWLEARFD